MSSIVKQAGVVVLLTLFAVSAALAAPVHDAPIIVTASIPVYITAATVSLDPLVLEVAANAPWMAVLTTSAGEVRLTPPGHFAGQTRLLWWREGVTVEAARVEAATWQP